jgi:hypothetical protein
MDTSMMDATSIENLRAQTIEAAKQHKASWIRLGQYLFTIHKDKLFKAWGYLSFETYCMKEVSMKRTTATKLLKSYSFLEQEEPRLVDSGLTSDSNSTNVPDYESVNLLRLAKDNSELTPQDYAEVRESVIEKSKEPKEVRAQVKKLLENNQAPEDPSEVRRQRRNTVIKRIVTALSNARKELAMDNLLPDYLVKQMQDLTAKLEDQIEE